MDIGSGPYNDKNVTLNTMRQNQSIKIKSSISSILISIFTQTAMIIAKYNHNDFVELHLKDLNLKSPTVAQWGFNVTLSLFI